MLSQYLEHNIQHRENSKYRAPRQVILGTFKEQQECQCSWNEVNKGKIVGGEVTSCRALKVRERTLAFLLNTKKSIGVF